MMLRHEDCFWIGIVNTNTISFALRIAYHLVQPFQAVVVGHAPNSTLVNFLAHSPSGLAYPQGYHLAISA